MQHTFKLKSPARIYQEEKALRLRVKKRRAKNKVARKTRQKQRKRAA